MKMLGVLLVVGAILSAALPSKVQAAGTDPASLAKIVAIQQAEIASLNTKIQNLSAAAQKGAQMLRCGDTNYKCRPMDCLNLCAPHSGLRMATISEVFAVAASGADVCAWGYALDPASPTKATQVLAMYSPSAGGCGFNTDVSLPRIVTSGVYNWSAPDLANCWCHPSP